MNWIAQTISTNGRIYLLVFLTATIMRLIVFVSVDKTYISPDSYTYHVLAVNLAEGNGYTASLLPPYVPNFTRDPAYPFFMSLVYRGYTLFHKLTLIPYNDIALNNSGGLLFFPKEMMWICIIQIILAAISCVFFYLILLNILKSKYALLIALLFSMYFPYSYNDLLILRESFQSSIAIIANYFFLSFISKNKQVYLVIFGVFWGILNLTLQTSLIIGVIFPLILLLSSRNFKQTLISTSIVFFAMLLTVSPYLLRTYNFFPDLKVVRSMGCSITFEKRNYYSTLIKLHNLSYFSQTEFDSLKSDLWSLPEKKTFEMSFNGSFDRKIKVLDTKFHIPRRVEIKYIAKNWFIFAYKSWFRNIYRKSENSFITNLKTLNLISLMPNILSIVFGIFAFAGTILYFRCTYILQLVFLSTVSIFFIIGDESRRSLPAQPYIFMFAMLFIITIYFIKKKISLEHIKLEIFL